MIAEIFSFKVVRTILCLYTITLCIACMMVVLVTKSAFAESTNHVIEINGFTYSPNEVVVSPGDSITWVNNDFVSHTATAFEIDSKGNGAGKSELQYWTTEEVAAGEKKTIVVGEKMTLVYFCKYHPTMTASLSLHKRNT